MLDLLCDEDWLATPPALYTTTDRDERKLEGDDDHMGCKFNTRREDWEDVFMGCLQKEATYMPEEDYVKRLHKSDPHLMHARFRAIQFFIKSRSHLNLDMETVFNAANYFDRFVSKNQGNVSTAAFMELLSIACLSIAAKFHEVSAPQLHQLQMEENSSFPSDSIQRMELSVLQSLEWRLRCVTAYSYIDPLTSLLDSLQPHLHCSLTSRMAELTLATLSDPKFVEFNPCTIAVSALRCGLEELLPSKSNSYLSSLMGLIPQNQKEDIYNCYKMMEERVADPIYSLTAYGYPYFPSSPVTVMVPPRNIGKFNSHIDLSLCLVNPSNPKKRKLEEDI